MKLVNIPFVWRRAEMGYETHGRFMLDHLNRGMVGCRRLGLTPVAMTLGKKEVDHFKGLTYLGQSEEERWENSGKLFNIKVIQSSKPSRCIFHCKVWSRVSERKKLEKLLKVV